MIKIFFAFLLISFSGVVFADVAVDNYSATVHVINQSESQRQIAFPVALKQVIDALLQEASVKQQADLSPLLEHPEQYVESFSYIADPEQEDGLEIVVHFDSAALNQFFKQQGSVNLQTLTIEVSAITSEQILEAMTHYLKQISSVKSVAIDQVKGEDVMLVLGLQGDVASFTQILVTDQHLVALGEEDRQKSSVLRFEWVA